MNSSINGKTKPVYSSEDNKASTYLDIQAEVGISKHHGGYQATDSLHQRCHLEDADEVLEVGCGIGVGAVYIAKKYNCRVEAVDISDKMLSWARKRAEKEGVTNLVHFKNANILDLPYENDRFDAVIVESVLSFVDDKTRAIQELVRVTRPGGFIGLNEFAWTEKPPPEILAQSTFVGIDTLTRNNWEELWDSILLEDRLVNHLGMEAKQELRERIRWVGGWREIFKVWGRVIKLLLANPEARDALKQQMDVPPDVAKLIGYCLLSGKVPE